MLAVANWCGGQAVDSPTEQTGIQLADGQWFAHEREVIARGADGRLCDGAASFARVHEPLPALSTEGMTDDELHRARLNPDYEYATTQTPRSGSPPDRCARTWLVRTSDGYANDREPHAGFEAVRGD